MSTLVWMTNSFRKDSRLTSKLGGYCAFVYYSPYHFAGDRERNIYKNCSQENLDLFYQSINRFNSYINNNLHIYRVNDVVAHINALVADQGFTKLVIDQPLFAMWHTVDLSKIKCRIEIIDSALIDDTCVNLTAKSRWTKHIEKLSRFKPHQFNTEIVPIKISTYDGHPYPTVTSLLPQINLEAVYKKIHATIQDYHTTRDRHDGQTGMSVALHNGVIDPANTFYAIAKEFTDHSLTSPAAAILRQQAFRELSIIQARRANMTLENTPLEWAKALMHSAAFDNLITATPNPSCVWLTADLLNASTGIHDLDFLITNMGCQSGQMPNRARMYFASKVFYESPTGISALETLIDVFDLKGVDGQSPNNYTQCIGAFGLSYGKVLKMNRDTAFSKLSY